MKLAFKIIKIALWLAVTIALPIVLIEAFAEQYVDTASTQFASLLALVFILLGYVSYKLAQKLKPFE